MLFENKRQPAGPSLAMFPVRDPPEAQFRRKSWQNRPKKRKNQKNKKFSSGKNFRKFWGTLEVQKLIKSMSISKSRVPSGDKSAFYEENAKFGFLFLP